MSCRSICRVGRLALAGIAVLVTQITIDEDVDEPLVSIKTEEQLLSLSMGAIMNSDVDIECPNTITVSSHFRTFLDKAHADSRIQILQKHKKPHRFRRTTSNNHKN